MTQRSSMHAIIRIAPLQAGQLSMFIPKTRLKRSVGNSSVRYWQPSNR